jgi:hypothetical protein
MVSQRCRIDLLQNLSQIDRKGRSAADSANLI